MSLALDKAHDAILWRPLIDGSLALTVRSVVAEIAQALANDLAEPADPGLMLGLSGRALFFGYLAQAVPDSGYQGWPRVISSARSRR
jgi:hypothetical protein